MEDNPALADETNDILTSLLLSAETQERYLKKIHYWVRLAGSFFLLWIIITAVLGIGFLAGSNGS